MNKSMPKKLAAVCGMGFLLVLIYWAVAYSYPKITLMSPVHVTENFRSMAEIFPSARITRSAKPLQLETAEQTLSRFYAFKQEKRELDDFLKRSKTTGFLVLHQDRIIAERYFLGNDAASLATSFSVAKSFVATLVGIAWQEGLITSLAEPVTHYVPALRGTGFDGVPIADILQMSSGIKFSEDYDDKSSDAYRIFDELFLFMRPLNQAITDYGSQHKAGQQFYYASINTQALAMLIEAVSGMPVASYLQEKLWQPMGASSDARWLQDLYGTEIAFWGLNATARDYAKLGLLYSHGGVLNGQRILSEEWIALATRPDKAFLQAGQIDQAWGYQYQWWVPAPEQGDFMAIGIWGQMIYVNPAAQLVIVKTSADPDFKQHEVEAVAAFRAIASGITPALLGQR